MLFDIIRFNHLATRLLDLPEDHCERKMSLGAYLRYHNYSESFAKNYLIPMTAAIWSTPVSRFAYK
jgi:predicted NAD/FAD-binding protein